MHPVGAILRSERERQGRDLAAIAEELCIMQGYVRALEDGNVKLLPGLFFYKSFARQYAALLGLDEKVIAPHLSAMSAGEEAVKETPPVRLPDPIVVTTNRLQFPDFSLGWSVVGLAAVLTVCSMFYSWWNQPRPVSSASVPVQQTAPAVTVQDVALKSPDAGPTGGVALTLSATEKTWLSIRSGGHEVFSGVLEPNQSKTLTGLDIATMKVGNAGGIEIHWNGKSVGPLGSSGQVLTVRFTEQNYEIVPAPPKQEL